MRISDWSSDVCSSDLIEDLMLSCRIQGKFIENALLHHLCTRPEWCASFVEIVFKPTDRNAAAQSALSRLGFTPVEPALLRIDAAPGQFHPKFMTIVGTHGIQRIFWGRQIEMMLPLIGGTLRR